MPALRIGLVARVTLANALAALGEAASWLDAHGCTPIIDDQSADAVEVIATDGMSGTPHMIWGDISNGPLLLRYSPEPLEEPEPGTVLLCCSAPAEAVALDL